ncbi:unnamed protein product, partial [Rotaria sordida]
MSTENFRFYIKVRTALNIQARIIYDELYSVYGDQAPSLKAVERWSKLYREGREEIEDKTRPGRPITETTSENIEQIVLLINDNPYLTIEQLEDQTDLSHGIIHQIITDHLNLRKITARYVPKDLADFQRTERVRICKENLARFQQGTWRLCDIITVRTALNIQARIIHDELYSVYGDQAPSLRTVERWSKLFREGREKIEDKTRPGRPITETTSENIEQIGLLINDSPYLTIEQLEDQTDLSHGTIHRIITDHLNLRKITARYVTKDLTDFQRTERVRMCKEDLAKFQPGTWRLCDIITGEELWFFRG